MKLAKWVSDLVAGEVRVRSLLKYYSFLFIFYCCFYFGLGGWHYASVKHVRLIKGIVITMMFSPDSVFKPSIYRVMGRFYLMLCFILYVLIVIWFLLWVLKKLFFDDYLAKKRRAKSAKAKGVKEIKQDQDVKPVKEDKKITGISSKQSDED